MRSTSLLALALTASTVVAQEPQPPQQTTPSQQRTNPAPEIGFRSGFVRVTTKDEFFSESGTILAAPSSFFGPASGVHFTFFVSPRVALEPQMSIMRITEGGDTFSITMLGAQFLGFLGPDATRAPYLFGVVATFDTDDGFGGSSSQNGFGGGIGYRRVVRNSLGLRYEARVFRRSESGTTMTEVGLLIGIGAVINPPSKP